MELAQSVEEVVAKVVRRPQVLLLQLPLVKAQLVMQTHHRLVTCLLQLSELPVRSSSSHRKLRVASSIHQSAPVDVTSTTSRLR